MKHSRLRSLGLGIRSHLASSSLTVLLALAACSSSACTSTDASTGGGGQGGGAGGARPGSGGSAQASGGAQGSGGVPGSGGSLAGGGTSGALSTGGRSGNDAGGDTPAGDGGSDAGAATTGRGGRAGSGGVPGTGGISSSGGAASKGGTSGGATSKGGASGTADAAAGGASAGASGAADGSAGSSGDAGAGHGTPPGDLAAAAGTPLVAAHSVTRAMYASYDGKLFQARRPSDGTSKDIGTAGAGGLVDLSTLDAFCSGTTCTVSKLYDQSGNGNDLAQATVANQPTVGFWTAADGTKYPIIVSKGYQWLRNRNQTKKIPTGSSPQTEYFVVHGDYAGRAANTNGCCYDYGNMENHIGDDGPGTMTALYFGDATDWTRGAGNGPWVMLDMENGVFAGGGSIAILNAGSSSVNASDPSLEYPSPNIVTGLAKTDGKSSFALKYGNASSGALSVAWSGSLPTNKNPTSYIPLQQQGGLSLGEGGDGSAMGTGAFSEGAIIAAQTSDATDDAIQASLTTLYR